MGLLYSCMAISLYVPLWYNHDPFGTRPNLKLSWRSKGLPRERLSSLVVMPQEGRCSILYLMSIIECRIPPQSCVLFLEHSAPVGHTALCRDAARFALSQNLVWPAWCRGTAAWLSWLHTGGPLFVSDSSTQVHPCTTIGRRNTYVQCPSRDPLFRCYLLRQLV